MSRNYYEQCYLAFYWTLEHIFKQSHQPIAPHPFSLCDLLSNMCPFTFTSGMSADPAVYYDYKTILEEIAAASAEESVGNGYRAGMEFLQMYRSEYEYELEETIQAFSLEVYTSAYEKVRDENTE